MRLLQEEATNLLESKKSDFLKKAFEFISSHSVDEDLFERSILEYYESLYKQIIPSSTNLLKSLGEKSFLKESILIKLGWYLATSFKNEEWVGDFIFSWEELILEKADKNRSIKPNLSVFKECDESFLKDDSLLRSFVSMKAKGVFVTFLNLYKGVHIKNSGEVLRVDEDSVTFSIDSLQEAAIRNDNQAYILQNSVLEKPLKADICYAKSKPGEISLRNFVYLIDMPASLRESARVHPRVATPVTLKDKKSSLAINGILFDISTGGLGVLSRDSANITAGSVVEVSFELKDEGEKIQIMGEVINLVEHKEAFRFSIKFLPSNVSMQEAINTHVRAREKETIKELKEQFVELF
ncbi:MAG: PilZ domain-containing protein [Sulfurospirillaceae bacterium]